MLPWGWGRVSRGLCHREGQTSWCPLGHRASSWVLTQASIWLYFVFYVCSIQDIAILFNVIIIFLMFFNTFVFQAGLVSLLFHKFKGTIILTAMYLALSISLHVWVMVRLQLQISASLGTQHHAVISHQILMRKGEMVV